MNWHHSPQSWTLRASIATAVSTRTTFQVVMPGHQISEYQHSELASVQQIAPAYAIWRVGHTYCRGHGHPKVISRTGTPVHCSAVLVCTGCPFVPALSRHRLANLQQSRRGHADITHCACTLFDMKVSFMHRSRRTAAVISACSQGTGRVQNATPYNSNHI